jgi:hypothetical protein
MSYGGYPPYGRKPLPLAKSSSRLTRPQNHLLKANGALLRRPRVATDTTVIIRGHRRPHTRHIRPTDSPRLIKDTTAGRLPAPRQLNSTARQHHHLTLHKEAHMPTTTAHRQDHRLASMGLLRPSTGLHRLLVVPRRPLRRATAHYTASTGTQTPPRTR